MNCSECKGLLGEILLGPGSNDPQAIREMEEHLASCYFCQEEREHIKSLREDLLPLKESFPPVTDAQVEELKRKVRAKVRALEEDKKQNFWLEKGRGLAMLACLAIVAIALLSAGVYEVLKQALGGQQEELVVKNPTLPYVEIRLVEQSEKSSAAARSEFDKRGSPKDALAWLKARFEGYRKDPSAADFNLILGLSEQLREKWPDSWEAVLARKIESNAWMELANPDRSLEKFLEYAEAFAAKLEATLLTIGKDKEAAHGQALEARFALVQEKADVLLAANDSLALRVYDIQVSQFATCPGLTRVHLQVSHTATAGPSPAASETNTVRP